jgi:hypothetical protein
VEGGGELAGPLLALQAVHHEVDGARVGIQGNLVPVDQTGDRLTDGVVRVLVDLVIGAGGECVRLDGPPVGPGFDGDEDDVIVRGRR